MPNAFRNALDALANLAVSGVTNHYAITEIPDALNRAQLPALLVLPLDTERNNIFREKGEGFETLAFSNGTRTVSYAVTHLLLIAPEASGTGLKQHLPELISAIDAYFTALSTDLTLNNTLLTPPQVRVETGIYAYGGVRYVGCAFRHLWSIGV